MGFLTTLRKVERIAEERKKRSLVIRLVKRMMSNKVEVRKSYLEVNGSIPFDLISWFFFSFTSIILIL